MLALLPQDITLPEVMEQATGSAVTMIGLGVRTGTQAKRPQAVLLRDHELTALARWVLASTPEGDRLFPYSYEQYRCLLLRVFKKLALETWAGPRILCGPASHLT